MSKKLILLLMLVSISISSFAQLKKVNWGSAPSNIGPLIKFDTYEHNFGDLYPNTSETFDFNFKNTGGQPLIISFVEAACDCTSATWPDNPVMPGEEGVIKVQYDTKTRYGKFHKVVTVFANTLDGKHKLYFGGVTLKTEAPLMPVSNTPEDKVTAKAKAVDEVPPAKTAAKTAPKATTKATTAAKSTTKTTATKSKRVKGKLRTKSKKPILLIEDEAVDKLKEQIEKSSEEK